MSHNSSADQVVVEAAFRRAAAFAARDETALRRLMHPDLQWTTFKGDILSYEEYLEGNLRGSLLWRAQRLEDIRVGRHPQRATQPCLITGELSAEARRATDER